MGKGAIKKILSDFSNYRRNEYNKKKQAKLINKNISIISNNCIAGIIYHDLSLKFLSPTINLYFSDEDFVKYVKNIKDFSNGKLEQVETGEKFPCGKLTAKNGESIIIYFMHYKTFEEAKQKWIDRTSRLNYDNLYVIFEGKGKVEHNLVEEFSQLELKKVYLTDKKDCISLSNKMSCVDMKIYNKKYRNGMLIEYKNKLSKKRFLDTFDYVNFFNN